MNSEKRIGLALELYENLNREVNRAGGVGWNWNQLNNLTAAELIVILATNDIKFVYMPPAAFKTTNEDIKLDIKLD